MLATARAPSHFFRMLPAPRITFLLLAFAFATATRALPQTRAQNTGPAVNTAGPTAAGDDIVTMDTFAVSAAKYQWRYAKSAHFEILSAIDDTRLVSRIIQRAEQIIGAFEKNNALFRMPRELPSKIIFIGDKGIDRYLVRTGNENLQHARDKPSSGVRAAGKRADAARQVSARAFHDGEQAVFLKLITQKYLEGSTPFDAQVRENALDLALNYFQACVDTQAATAAFPDPVPWLMTALNSLRGHGAGAPWRLPDGFESPAYHFASGTFDLPAWFTINDDEMALGRYCLSCEADLLRKASDFPRGSGADEAVLARLRQLWPTYTPAPDASLGDFLAPPAAEKGKRAPKKTFASINAAITTQREALDFTYYCVFIADARTRAAFAQLVASAGRQPVTEATFKKYFGAGYDEFRARIYAFFTQLGRNNPDYKNNPWGPPAVVVAKFSSKDRPPPLSLRLASRGEIARMISDWFTLCGAGDMAAQTLLKAEMESAQARDDPEFLAALGLSEAASGRAFSAIARLEKAMAAKTVARPRAWRVLAQLRLDNILALHAPGYRLAKDELATITDPIAEAFSQSRASPQTAIQLAQVWTHTDIKPPKEYLDVLAVRCRAQPDNLDLLEAVLPLLARNGRADTARQLVKQSEQCILSADERRRLEALRGALQGTLQGK